MFTENPITIIESGNYNQIPIIIGYNSNENAFMGMMGESFNREDLKRIIPYFIRKNLDDATIEDLCQKLEKFYDMEDPTEKTLVSRFSTG